MTKIHFSRLFQYLIHSLDSEIKVSVIGVVEGCLGKHLRPLGLDSPTLREDNLHRPQL